MTWWQNFLQCLLCVALGAVWMLAMLLVVR
jgi:hypothetical protein